MANIFNVARYILKKKGEMSTLKLQKLCYYSQAWTMVWDDKPLFDEDFQAWPNGPVCKELFDLHKGMYLISINDIGNEYEEGELTDTEMANIDSVIKFYGDRSPQYLSDLTHMEDPWRIARGGCRAMDKCSNIITKESMASYYGSLQ